jgi:choline-glycine betaine transporter
MIQVSLNRERISSISFSILVEGSTHLQRAVVFPSTYASLFLRLDETPPQFPCSYACMLLQACISIKQLYYLAQVLIPSIEIIYSKDFCLLNHLYP